MSVFLSRNICTHTVFGCYLLTWHTYCFNKQMVQKEKEQYLSSAAHNNAITDVHNSDSAEQDDGAGGDTADESEVQHVVPSDDIVQMDQTIQVLHVLFVLLSYASSFKLQWKYFGSNHLVNNKLALPSLFRRRRRRFY